MLLQIDVQDDDPTGAYTVRLSRINGERVVAFRFEAEPPAEAEADRYNEAWLFDKQLEHPLDLTLDTSRSRLDRRANRILRSVT